MPLTNFRTTASWQAAIALGPGLVRLAEELPASEQLGLAWQLQQTMVELPAAIAFDLQAEGRDTRIPVLLQLIAALDLIERVYPALDTAAIRQATDALFERLSSDQFNAFTANHARSPEASPVQHQGSSVQHIVPAPEHAHMPEHTRVSVPVTSEGNAPAPLPDPAPAAVAPTPAPAPAPNVIIAPPPAAAPLPDQDDHVHADSSQ
jgi:hypothetical protein